jgi:hypothetical protein
MTSESKVSMYFSKTYCCFSTESIELELSDSSPNKDVHRVKVIVFLFGGSCKILNYSYSKQK